MLVVLGGTSNESVDAIADLRTANDFDVDATDIPAANLDGYRAVVAVHSAGDVLDVAQRSAL